jgi:polysaccharide biosynthesis protein PelF
MSSISEGFPYTVIEAMLCGSAIVATDVGGVEEALGDTGLVVPANCPLILAESIVKLLSLTSQQRQQMGDRARSRAIELFTQQQCVDTYLNTYRQLIRQARISKLKLAGKS